MSERFRFLLAAMVAAGCGSSGGDKPPPPQGLPFDAAPIPATPDANEVDAGPLGVDAPLVADAAVVDTGSIDMAAPADAAADASADGALDLPPPRPVTVRFTGTVATVAGTPLGFDDTVRTAPVSGSFTYDLRTKDQTPADPRRGRFEHGTTSAFTFMVKGHTIEGSGWAIVQTEDLDPDTFRYLDGPQGDTVPRVMEVDGAPAAALKLFIAISDGNGLLQGDALPDPFPAIDIAHTPHTFSLQDQGGTLLMQLDTLTSP
jgi:hypothetical protein